MIVYLLDFLSKSIPTNAHYRQFSIRIISHMKLLRSPFSINCKNYIVPEPNILNNITVSWTPDEKEDLCHGNTSCKKYELRKYDNKTCKS